MTLMTRMTKETKLSILSIKLARILIRAVLRISISVSNEKLKDYILRLKTTSIHTAKYAETLNVLMEILQFEEETAERTQNLSLLNEPNSITAQLQDISNYKFIVKAVQSRDEAVVAHFLDIVVRIGHFDKYVQVYRTQDFIRSLVKVYRTSHARHIKVKCLRLLNALLKNDVAKNRQVG